MTFRKHITAWPIPAYPLRSSTGIDLSPAGVLERIRAIDEAKARGLVRDQEERAAPVPAGPIDYVAIRKLVAAAKQRGAIQ